MSSLARSGAVSVAALAVLSGAEARAERGLELHYRRPPALSRACPDELAFRDLVYLAHDGDPFAGAGDAGPRGRVVIHLAAAGRAFEVSWEHSDVSGRLVGEGKEVLTDCRTAVEAAITALVVTLPSSRKPVQPPPAPPAVESVHVVLVPSPPPPPSVPPAKPAAAPAKRWPQVRAGVAAGARFGVAPTPTLGMSVDTGVGWQHVSLSVEGRLTSPVSFEKNGLHLNTWLPSAALVPCGHWRWAVGCALLEGGALQASASTKLTPDTAPYFAGGLRAGLEIPVGGRMALRAMAEAAVPVRARFTERGQAEGGFWTMPPITGALTGGLTGFF